MKMEVKEMKELENSSKALGLYHPRYEVDEP